MLYQMLVGRPPFQAAQSIDVIFKHLNEAPPIFAAVWPHHDVPQEVEALVMRCLAKRPEQRFQSMDELLDALRRAAAAAGLSGAFSARIPTGNYNILPGSNSGPHAAGAPSGASTVALDIAVEEPARSGRRMLPLALFGGSLLLGLGVAVVLALRAPQAPPSPAVTQTTAPAAHDPAPQPPPQPPTEQPPPSAVPELSALTPASPAPIRFLLSSEPTGAMVTYEGRELGITPLELEVPPGAEGHASARLSFSLEGYQRAAITLEGHEPVVRFTQKLKKKPAPRPAEAEKSGYKEDPY
jgi:serine/threonine-protein kinase